MNFLLEVPWSQQKMSGSTTLVIFRLLNIWSLDQRREKNKTKLYHTHFFMIFQCWKVIRFLFSQHDTYMHGKYSQYGKYLGSGCLKIWWRWAECLLQNGTLPCEWLQTPQHPESSMTNTEKHTSEMARSAGKDLGSNPNSATCWLWELGWVTLHFVPQFAHLQK